MKKDRVTAESNCQKSYCITDSLGNQENYKGNNNEENKGDYRAGIIKFALDIKRTNLKNKLIFNQKNGVPMA